MSTNLAQESIQWKAIAVLYLGFTSLLLIVRLLFFAAELPAKPIDIYWIIEKTYWIVVYPLIYTFIIAQNFRKASLTICDYSTIQDFECKLNKRIEKFSLAIASKTETEHVYFPISAFKKKFNNWFNSELVTLKIYPKQIIITGSLNRVSQIEDTLKWNKDFKA
jgi:hypothetical protein